MVNNNNFISCYIVIFDYHTNYLKNRISMLNSFVICCLYEIRYDRHNYFLYDRPSILDPFALTMFKITSFLSSLRPTHGRTKGHPCKILKSWNCDDNRVISYLQVMKHRFIILSLRDLSTINRGYAKKNKID